MSRRSIGFWLLMATLSLTTGCIFGDDDDNNTTQDNTDASQSTDTSATGLDDTGTTTTPDTTTVSPASGWEEIKTGGPCGGSRTNAIWFDDRMNGFIGCGENAVGEGLFQTQDGGLTWESLRKFEQVRVNDIRRNPDGKLYGAGFHTIDKYSAFLIDESGAELTPVGLFQPGNDAPTKVAQGENVAQTADGQMLVDSLTGPQGAYAADGIEFTEFRNFDDASIDDPDIPAFQLRRLVNHNNAFYGVGSVINDPAQVRLPSQHPDATYHFTTVALQSENRDGELHDMYIWSSDHMIVAGYDQSEQYPLIYVAQGDPYDRGNWQQIELYSSGIEYHGDIVDIHVVGDTVIAAGEKVPNGEGGFVVRSDDRGITWTDITPVPTTNLGRIGTQSAIWLFENGDMLLAGGGGELWQYTAP